LSSPQAENARAMEAITAILAILFI
jgi:hypothetical protein